MKNIGLKVATIVCGGLAFMSGLLALLGLLYGFIDICLFFAVPTLIFGIPTIKLAKKLGWIKPKVKVNKVKEEPKVESEQLMFDLKEELVKEEKPVKEKVVNIKDFKQEKEQVKTEPKEEKTAKEKVKKEKPAKDDMNWLDKWGAKIEEGNWFAIIGILLFWVVIIVGGIALAIWLIGVLISGIAAVIGFLFNAIMYVVGAIVTICLFGWFISFWWSLVRYEHIDKPRGIVRVKVKNRRRW